MIKEILLGYFFEFLLIDNFSLKFLNNLKTSTNDIYVVTLFDII